MNAKTVILTAAALFAGIAARAQDPVTEQPDTLGKVEQLKEAAVIARRELVTTDADKLTYNVEADPLSAGSNLIDILRNVPMLSINGDEEVLLNGSKDYKVLVNGRSTGMLARNFNQLIKTIPASSIKEIQVIRGSAPNIVVFSDDTQTIVDNCFIIGADKPAITVEASE